MKLVRIGSKESESDLKQDYCSFRLERVEVVGIDLEGNNALSLYIGRQVYVLLFLTQDEREEVYNKIQDFYENEEQVLEIQNVWSFYVCSV